MAFPDYAFCVAGLAPIVARIVVWCTTAPKTTTSTTTSGIIAFRTVFLGPNLAELTALLPQGAFGIAAYYINKTKIDTTSSSWFLLRVIFRPLELLLFEWNLVIGPGLSPPKSKELPCTECLRATDAGAAAGNRCSKCCLVLCPRCRDGSRKRHEESAECSVLSRADSAADVAWKMENTESLALAVMPIR